jgi:hypothetical protein
MTIYTDAYGNEAAKERAVYTVVLTGSFYYCHLRKGYVHEVDREKSNIPLSKYFYEKCLTP